MRACFRLWVVIFLLFAAERESGGGSGVGGGGEAVVFFVVVVSCRVVSGTAVSVFWCCVCLVGFLKMVVLVRGDNILLGSPTILR